MLLRVFQDLFGMGQSPQQIFNIAVVSLVIILVIVVPIF